MVELYHKLNLKFMKLPVELHKQKG